MLLKGDWKQALCLANFILHSWQGLSQTFSEVSTLLQDVELYTEDK